MYDARDHEDEYEYGKQPDNHEPQSRGGGILG